MRFRHTAEAIFHHDFQVCAFRAGQTADIEVPPRRDNTAPLKQRGPAEASPFARDGAFSRIEFSWIVFIALNSLPV